MAFRASQDRPRVTRRQSRAIEPLGPLEDAIMKGLWSRSSGTANELTRMINCHKPEPLSHKTILTCLTRLERKGLVFHTKESRSFRFFPALSAEETAAKFIGEEVTEILNRFGDLAVAVFVDRLAPAIHENPELELLAILRTG
jgi:predicted transcriptional regulator